MRPRLQPKVQMSAADMSVEPGVQPPGVATERSLVARARLRDFAAFEELVVRHRSLVYSLALHAIQDPRVVETVLDETFLAAWEELPRFDGAEPLAAWLAKVCGRQIALRAPVLDGPGVVTSPPSKGGLHRVIVAAVAGLPFMQRAAFALLVLGGLPLEDVASSLGLTAERVALHLREARARVHEALEDGSKAQGPLSPAIPGVR